MWRVCIFPTPQRILHTIEITAHRVQIFGGKESGFLEMVEKALYHVSFINFPNLMMARTLMVEVMEYLETVLLSFETVDDMQVDSVLDRKLTRPVLHCCGQ